MVGAVVETRASWLLSLFTYRTGRQPFHWFSARRGARSGNRPVGRAVRSRLRDLALSKASLERARGPAVVGGPCVVLSHATARRNTRVAQASAATQSGTRTANACQVAGVARSPAESERDATTR